MDCMYSLNPPSRAIRGLILTAAGLLLLSACGESRNSTTLTGNTMGTTYSVKISGTEIADIDALGLAVDTRLSQLNQSMSTYDENSELSRINRNRSGDWVSLSDELFDVLQVALEVSIVSGGAFDITVGPLVNLWGFGPDGVATIAPDPKAIAKVQDAVGYRKVMLRFAPLGLRKANPDTYIDLSALAKGYAVDVIHALLKDRGLTDFMVEIGGEVRASGHNADGVPWRIGIEQPLPGVRQIQQVVGLTGRSLATSGDYRNYFDRDGKHYSHTIDPASGRPVTHNLASVTVIHESAMYADAMATALLVMGMERGYELAKELDLQTLLIARNGEQFVTRSTEEFADYLVE